MQKLVCNCLFKIKQAKAVTEKNFGPELPLSYGLLISSSNH